ncbi:SRPBCC family protein [Hoeflea prorocentri]|uniref:SRPBCC family protein n=1 Tax=Hoeflea prorocentri TaxID=1922333 RepID=A0A9X3ZJH8_9HYPH|nr:SRPBCC family protein [Hoeflea prorocentri]MCY6382996.1 SRPBCC family protein [Hoeflea prorocentri]MDA5400796.1 SRPBCC family protein [Hoeflea prorocentri]
MNTYLTVGAIAVAIIVATPFLLPASKTVERSAIVPAPANEVFPVIASNEGYQRFNPYKQKDPDLKITMHGPSSGVGSGFAFEGKDGKGTQTITALDDNRSVTMLIDLGAMGKPVTTFGLEPAADGTKVTWSTRMEFGMNPVGRVFGIFLDRMLGPDYELGLKLLAGTVSSRN